MMKATRWRQWRGACLTVWLVGVGAAAGCDAAPEPDGPGAVDRGGDRDAPTRVQLAGELCLATDECAPGEYCATAPGECGREGVCTAAPSECERVRDYMCGCDGVTYYNACFAAQDLQSVDYAGSCPPPACTSNAECSATSYCAKATGDCPGTGTCQTRPPLCSGAWNPVCGCNGKTYANACKAAAVGVTIAKLGTC